MELWLAAAVLGLGVYAWALRNNVSTLKELNEDKDAQIIGYKELVKDLKEQVELSNTRLADYVNSVTRKVSVDNSKTGKDLVDETNNLLGQTDLFAPENDDDERSHAVKLPND